MGWAVIETRRVAKQKAELPDNVHAALVALEKEIEIFGPVRGNWPNYSKLGKQKHHCHIKNGRPTYVACWEVIDRNLKLIEVNYAGTREKAPY